jgi:hypothetical protein
MLIYSTLFATKTELLKKIKKLIVKQRCGDTRAGRREWRKRYGG